MKINYTILILIITSFSFGQETDKNTKTIRGFIFENTIPQYPAAIKIKGTERKTETDVDGKFEIEVKEGDTLIVEILGRYSQYLFMITDKNCYKIHLSREAGNPFITRKSARIERKYKRRIERRAKRKMKEGFYDCFD